MMNVDEEDDIQNATDEHQDDTLPQDHIIPEEDDEFINVSYHALGAHKSLNTVVVKGLVENQHVLNLLNSGSTHSFLHNRVVEKLNCNLVQATPFCVSTGGGNKLISNQKCLNFEWKMNNLSFSFNFRLLNIDEYDLVLGADWMRSFNHVYFDFCKNKLPFINMVNHCCFKVLHLRVP
ncbi:conserved hypothetical protein [Ricinus communis]|uniref:Uncharacterized protein n=1 Tax=Ricinus communis TaxID=3988 RepID=B9RY72_RICCO|nr:conserved hypothetical protein [Ricinus communis]